MRPSMLGVKDHNGPASVKTECCGNPLRGCINCPPQQKLSFEEWWADNPPPRFTTSEEFFNYIKTVWQAAQENKE